MDASWPESDLDPGESFAELTADHVRDLAGALARRLATLKAAAGRGEPVDTDLLERTRRQLDVLAEETAIAEFIELAASLTAAGALTDEAEGQDDG